MSQDPFKYGEELTNSKGQLIEFYEHPTKGDETFILVVCHTLEAAAYSGFFETDDMMASHGEYEPSFDEENNLWIGEFSQE